MSTKEDVILPVAYFPPISYFIALVKGRGILIETGETFPKQTIRNRCEIATSGGRQKLIVPIHKPHGNHTRTHEVVISSHGEWPKKHWRALESAYSSSPFFLYYSDMVRELIFGTYPSLESMNLHILDSLLERLKIKTGYTISRGYAREPQSKKDLRGEFSKKWPRPFLLPVYHQVFSPSLGFIQDLSILDLLYNLGPESVPYLESTPDIIT